MKTTILRVVTIAASLAGASILAQTHKVTAPDTVVRAVAVYEWTGDLAKPAGSRLVPVSLFINGELEDAGLYPPRPVPFALVSGNVYELEDAGLAKGTVELETALKTTLPDNAPGPAFDAGWTAYGSYKAPAAPRHTAAALRPLKNQPVIVSSSSDSRPHFSNKSSDTSAKSTDSSQPDNSKTDTASKTGGSNSSDDPDRPTMKRRDSNDTTASSADPDKTNPDDEAERPTLKRRSPEDEKNAKDRRKNTDVATVRSAGSLNDDPDRPTLHHGGSEGGSADIPKLLGVPANMHQMVAVSDAKNREPHPFVRPWDSDQERAAVLAKMQAFARSRLADYGVVPGITPANAIASSSPAATTSIPQNSDGGPPTLKRGIPTAAKTPSLEPPAPAAPAKATTKAPAAGKTAAKTHRASAKPAVPQITLADEQLKGYLLSYGGTPTYVYMAHTVETGSVMRYVTLVAQADAMGEIKLALSSVTDAAHLDRTPWMRLVDAVDVEASNRASLLFELRGQSSRQFALYRVIAAKPEQIFITSGGL